MAIPTSQLQTWSHQGSVTQSTQTYETVKNALEAAGAHYTDRNFKVFLQGSYGNDTNIWAESDVDVVIRHDGEFFRDISRLPPNQLAAYNSHYTGLVGYPYPSFKNHVQAALKAAFGNSVKPGTKAIKIDASNSRRNADVVVASEYRRYHKFNSIWDESHTKGIGFLDSAGTLIANFPNQHCENLTSKHQATHNRFKPTVRMFKNMRTKLVGDGVIADGIAPSYYIEGLLYNVPNDNFVSGESERVYNILKWLGETQDRSKFVCANEQYYLLFDNSPVCWPKVNGATFVDAVIKLWNNWK